MESEMNETQKQIDKILSTLSDLLQVPIEFRQTIEDQGRVLPAYDVNAILSKQIALFVYTGLSVPSSFAPAYNRVHADVEWWKQHFEKIEPEKAKAQVETGATGAEGA
jgi:hypothetical protein